MKMRHPYLQAITIFVLLFPFTVTLAQTKRLDITTLFSIYKKRIVGSEAEKFIAWASPKDNGTIPSVDALSPFWKGHVRKPNVIDKGDYWFVVVKFRDVHFHGLPVSRFERWFGKGCGICGWSLAFNAPLNKARRNIDEKRFQRDKELGFEPILDTTDCGRGSKLIYDYSM